MRRLAVRALLVTAVAGCGARSDLRTDGDEGSGGATTTTTDTVTVGSGGGIPTACDALVLLDPIVPLPTPAAFARAPELGVLPEGDAWLSIIEAPPGAPGLLRVGRTNAFASWPPDYQAMVELDPEVDDYVTGPGATGPVALLERPSGPFLATSMLSTLEGIQFDADGVPLFAVGVPNRYLAASGFEVPDASVLTVESYEPGGLPQTEEPLLCATRPNRAAAVPTTDGFIAVYAAPNPPECVPDGVHRPSVVMATHYTVGGGPDLSYEETDYVVMDDTVLHVGLAPASFGAWEVFQGAGDNARQPPPIFTRRLDPRGIALDPMTSPVAVSPDGVTTPTIAVAPLGDTLVVAWIDSFDPSAPTIVLQLVRPDGTLGPSASIPTNAVWQFGRVRILASPAKNSLLVAWEGGLDSPTVGLARLDCVTGL